MKYLHANKSQEIIKQCSHVFCFIASLMPAAGWEFSIQKIFQHTMQFPHNLVFLYLDYLFFFALGFSFWENWNRRISFHFAVTGIKAAWFVIQNQHLLIEGISMLNCLSLQCCRALLRRPMVEDFGPPLLMHYSLNALSCRRPYGRHSPARHPVPERGNKSMRHI